MFYQKAKKKLPGHNQKSGFLGVSPFEKRVKKPCLGAFGGDFFTKNRKNMIFPMVLSTLSTAVVRKT